MWLAHPIKDRVIPYSYKLFARKIIAGQMFAN